MKSDTIKQYRLKRCLTQKELAEKTGLSQSFIARLENGEKQPSVDSLIKISKALRISVSRLAK